LLPYKEIWDNILMIQQFGLPFNMKNTKDKTDLTLEDILGLKDEFILSTLEYSEKIDKIMTGHSQIIDFTFRYKEDNSIERNWYKDDLLRKWLEQIPAHPVGHSLKSYVDYLYEKAFQQQNREEI